MLIIEYWLESTGATRSGATCCGEFKNWISFQKFVDLQKYYGKTVTQVRLVAIKQKLSTIEDIDNLTDL